MRKIVQFACLLFAIGCLAQAQPGDSVQKAQTSSRANDTGLVPLARPYAISTAPHFAVLVEFPKADSIRRIALGDSNYFRAEADKDDPHYAIIKQLRTAGPKTSIETNMLVYMASGRVINVMLKSGKLADTAYSIDYAVPKPQVQPDPPPPVISQEALERAKRERDREQLAEDMLDDVRKSPKKRPGIVAGGLSLHPYKTERFGDVALVSFDVENTSSGVVDLEDPQVNLVTESDKGKDRKKGTPAKLEPIQLTESDVSVKQLPPGARAVCLVAFKPPVHDSDQHVVLSVSNRAMADQPATFHIE